MKSTHGHVYNLSGTWDTAQFCRTVCKTLLPLPDIPFPLPLPQTLPSPAVYSDLVSSLHAFHSLSLKASIVPFMDDALYP